MTHILKDFFCSIQIIGKSDDWLIETWIIENELLHLKVDDEGPRLEKIATFASYVLFICIINPAGTHILTLNAEHHIQILDINDGNLIGEMKWNGTCLKMVSNPHQPYIAIGKSDGILDFINAYNPETPQILTVLNLCKEEISGLQISSRGNYLVACNMERGIFFVVESKPGQYMAIKTYMEIERKIGSFFIVEHDTELQLVILLSSRSCCRSGDKMLVYSMNYLKIELCKNMQIDLPGLYSELYAIPSDPTKFYGIPHRSRQLHLLQISTENQLELINALSMGHQLRKYLLKVTEHNTISYGMDGLAFIRRARSLKCISCVMTHHRFDLGIMEAVINPVSTHVVCMGQEGSIVCMNIKIELDTLKQRSLSNALLSKELNESFTQKKTSGFVSMPGALNPKTWLELQYDIKVMQEASDHGRKRMELIEEFQTIQQECISLLEKNYNNPPEEKLPISAFDLDDDTRNVKKKKVAELCKNKAIYLKALIKEQDNLAESLKEKFWDTVEIKDRKLKAIMGQTEVENYPMFPKDVAFENEMIWIKTRRKLEVQMQRVDYFAPWKQYEADGSEIPAHSSLTAFDDSLFMREAIRSVSETNEETEEENMINKLGLSGSSTYQFVEWSECHNDQFALITYLQMHNEIKLLMHVSEELCEYFNKQFNDVFSLKEREMHLVIERNARLRYVLSELNNTWTVIIDPVWYQEEQPERVMTVEDNEVPISPYISPSQQEILDRLAAEAEARRLAELADNFRERALIVMMDGVLEIRWEDEIKKDIPKPKCMLEKDPADFNQEDLRIIRDYEERVAFRLSERERYRKMLESELQKLSQTLKDGVVKFNNRLNDLFLIKIKIEAAIGQEMLKVYRYKLLVHNRLNINKHDKKLRLNIIKQEALNIGHAADVQKLQSMTNDCRAAYDALVTREKNLEKSFKKDFPEVSQVVLEQLLKFYRRRPKMHQRAQMSVALLHELSRLTVSSEKPTYLLPECIDFLKGLDHIDNYSNSPSIINEDLWNILCRVRRQRVECELKVKCCALEVAEAEQTTGVFQKKLAGEKQHITAMQDEILQAAEDLLELVHNTEIQLVLKQGYVEVKMTGTTSDFHDAILITREQVESINDLVKRAGNKKLTAMRKAIDFHRNILVKEWEHKKLRMHIEDLQEHLHNLESVKVTKDIQMFLRRRACGTNEEKSTMSLERELALLKESYENQIKDLQEQMDELDKKIKLQYKQNRKWDAKITDVNVDVSEQHLLRDLAFEAKQTETAKRRMASIVKRSRLVSTIQKQHQEILALQTELELLRLKIYPTLKYKTLI